MLLLSLSTLLIGIVSCYTLYYIFRKVSKPQLSCGQGTFRTHLLEHCPILQRPYCPTWWAFNRHIMTIGRVVLQKGPPHLKYKRETTSPDNNILDWYYTDSYNTDLKENAPILLILPGTSSSTKTPIIHWLVYDGIMQNYRPVVMNYRGSCGVPLKTIKDMGPNPGDISLVINHIYKCWPKAPIIAIGISLGGLFLVQHLIRTQEQCGLVAVATLSSPWNYDLSMQALEGKVSQLYNFHMTRTLADHVERSLKTLDEGKEFIQKVRKCSTLREYDATITVPVLGYNNIEDYYRDVNVTGKCHQIKTPLLSITSSNDPCVPPESLPLSEFQTNSNTMLAVVQHGGHLGFLEGWFPFGRTWMNKVAQEFLVAMKTYTK